MLGIETNLLSAAMFDSENMLMAIERGVKPEWFSNAVNASIFEFLTDAQISNHWNPRTSINILASTGLFTKQPDALEMCNNTPAWSHNVEEYAEALEMFACQYAGRVVDEITSDARNKLICGEDPMEVASSMTSEAECIESIMVGNRIKNTKDIAKESLRIDTMIANGERVGLPFPWNNFQRNTFGIPMKAVTPIGGRDGKGKSRLMTYLTDHWIKMGIPVLYFPFEDSGERMMSNMAATRGGYDMFTIKRGHVPNGFMENHALCLKSVVNDPLFIEDVPATAERIVTTIARYKRKYGVQAVVIDGFKDMIETSGENRTQQENHMMSVLTRAAKRYDVAIIPVMHLTKIEDGHWISKQSIKGAGTQTQSARMALMYQDSGMPQWIKDKYGIFDEEDFIVLDCQKASYGSRDVVVLKPELEKGRFLEITTAEGEG